METTIILAESNRQLTLDEMRNLHRINAIKATEQGLVVLYNKLVKDGNVARRRICAYTYLLRHESVMEQYYLPEEFVKVFGTRIYTREEANFFNHADTNGMKRDPYICVMEVKTNGKFYYCWRLKQENKTNSRKSTD